MGTFARGVVVVCAIALSSAAAQAQQPSGARDDEARALFRAGQVAFDDGRFEDALRHFRSAYELSQRPALLFNIGTAADRLRRDDEALAAFREYIEREPNARDRTQVESRIRVLEAAVQERARQREQLARRPPVVMVASPHDDETPPRDDGEPEGGGLFYTWFALGGAVVLGALATYFWLDASADYDALRARCETAGGCTDAEVDAEGLDTGVTLANVFLIGSLLALGAGGVLLFVELSADGGGGGTETAVSIGGGSLVVRGSL